jgi:hypothetical protein
MEKHTVEVTFEGEEVSRITDNCGTTTLYRTPEGTYLVHMDTRYVTEEAARTLGRNAVLDVSPSQRGHAEHAARTEWPELFAAQSRQ